MKPDAYRALGLSSDEYGKILGLLGREPSPTELAMFSVQWSEHCSYSCSKKLLERLPRKGWCRHLVGEDSGGILIDDTAVIFKMESHNHPSQIEPRQGAATGVGGIIRDIFTAGARPVAILNSLRFGEISEAHNRYLLNGVVDGIQFYGNCLGVPTVGGEIYFDGSYSGNCLVNVMAIGVADKKDVMRARAEGPGNVIIYAGAGTGRDGIGGCSVLASNDLSENEESRPAVQIGDPFTEKCLIEATLEAAEAGCVIGIKDMGAAGLTCCTSEMASAGGCGIAVNLDKVPRKEGGMQAWEVMMSESQERILLCVEKGSEGRIKGIFNKWGLAAEPIGTVTDDGAVRVSEGGRLAANIKASFLTDAPVREMHGKRPGYMDELVDFNPDDIAVPDDLASVLVSLLGSPSIRSKKWVYEQYDYMVQTNTVVPPGSDAAVIRLKGTDKAIAATTDCNGRYCSLDPRAGAQIAVAEAARNIICSGGVPAAVTDCLNFGNPEKPEAFWYFENCIEGIAESCGFFGIPVVSGNVSFYNESPGSAVLPTPAIGMIGVVEDVGNVQTQHFKREGDVIILLGESLEEFGGSEYLKQMKGVIRGKAPKIDLGEARAAGLCVIEAIKKGLVNSAHDCSEGGLAAAIAESCISNEENMVGAVIDGLDFKVRPDAVLFGESQSRVVLSCSDVNASKVEEIAGRLNVPFKIIGRVGGETLKITDSGRALLEAPLAGLYRAWTKPPHG